MTPEEQNRLKIMEEHLKDIHRLLTGDPLSKTPGFIEEFREVKDRLESIETQMRKIKAIAIGVAVGVLIGGFFFGLVSWDSFIKWIKELK